MKQVLYVEDSATSQLLMRKYLVGMCELLITPSLRMAMALLSDRRFDLLIADFLFPEGDALDVIQHVRRTDSLKEMPVIVISSSMDGTLLSRVLKAGANDGAAKPVQVEEFRSMVKRMLEAPYVRSPDSTLTGVTCFQWSAQTTVYQFSPELNLTVSGSTVEGASARMLAALKERIAQGAQLGYINHETIVTHVVHD